MRAYVLINVSAGRALDVAAQVHRLAGVTAADAITGKYDVIAIFQADDFVMMGSLIVDRIQKIDGVLKTVTCVVLTG